MWPAPRRLGPPGLQRTSAGSLSPARLRRGGEGAAGDLPRRAIPRPDRVGAGGCGMAQAQVHRIGGGGGVVSTTSASPRPGLALADQSPKHAAFELERAGALQGDAARIGLAVLGVVDLPVPFVGRAARL